MSGDGTFWYDDDDFWRDTATTLFSRERWEAASEQVDQVLSLAATPPGAAVLDMPCGPGRHALEMARRGLSVTGVDRTAAYLEEARRRADRAGLAVEWIEADMRTFDGAGAFDLVINLFTSFGYFRAPEDDQRVAERFFGALKSGGRLVMDLMGKEVLAARFRERDWSRTDDGTLMLEERVVRDGWGWIDNTWTLLSDGQRREHQIGHRLFSATELLTLLLCVGFVEPRTYGTLAGTPYDHTAERLVVVAIRP